MKPLTRSSYEFHYFVHLFQDLFSQPLPRWCYLTDAALRRRLVIDWEAVIADLWPTPATLPHEGSLFALQLILTDPMRWMAHMPLLYERLDAYKPWLYPLPPLAQADHLDRNVMAGATADSLQRFHSIRQQIFRYLGGNSKQFASALRSSFEGLMEPILIERRQKGTSELETHIDTIRLGDLEGLTLMQLEAQAPLEPIETKFRTLIGQETAAILRGERFGVVKDKNYVYIRHAGMAIHIENIGDITPFHTAEMMIEANYSRRVDLLAASIRRVIRAKYRSVSDVTATRLFERHPQLKHSAYDPACWSVVMRSDVSRSLREHGLNARRRRERTEKLPTERKRRVATLKVPDHLSYFADNVNVLWRQEALYINCQDLKLVTEPSVTGLRWNDYLGFDSSGHITRNPEDIVELFFHRNVLVMKGMELLSKWIGAQLPKYETWLNATKSDSGKRKLYIAPFTRSQDAELLELWKPYQLKKVWQDFEEKHKHSAKEAKRRAEFVAFATRKRNLTLDELNDLATVEKRLGPMAWKKWHVVARLACS